MAAVEREEVGSHLAHDAPIRVAGLDPILVLEIVVPKPIHVRWESPLHKEGEISVDRDPLVGDHRKGAVPEVQEAALRPRCDLIECK